MGFGLGLGLRVEVGREAETSADSEPEREAPEHTLPAQASPGLREANHPARGEGGTDTLTSPPTPAPFGVTTSTHLLFHSSVQ